jgi:predicted flap endonuclease-1-like 5' DNA nuclease
MRLLVLGVLAAVAAFVLSRLMNPDDDFDEFDDIEAGFEFEETPVEIDVPVEADMAAEETKSGNGNGMASATMSAETPAETADLAGSANGATATEQDAQAATSEEDDLTSINGIGPAYQGRLHALGITGFAQLAAADADQLADQLGVAGGRQAVTEWITQAEQLRSQGPEAATSLNSRSEEPGDQQSGQ